MSEAAAIGEPQGDVDDGVELVLRDASPGPRPVLAGELVAPAEQLVDRFVATFIARPQTQRSYRRACARFVCWLGPLAGPEDLTAVNVAAYHAQLVAGGLASATIKKERAALNSFLRWLVEHELIAPAQAREALAIRLPRARQAPRAAPKALSRSDYEALLRAAQAAIVSDPLAGARDLAIVLVLGDAGLRCEELAGLRRYDFRAARAGAKLRALEVRHGKGDSARVVKLSKRATRAILRWERARRDAFGPVADDAALFITLGRRRHDGTYVAVGGRCGQPTLAAIVKRLGAAARIPEQLRHPHALRHTCATELLREGATIADVRTFLGHASVKTTSIYLASDEQRQEDIVERRERGRNAIDEDLDALG